MSKRPPSRRRPSFSEEKFLSQPLDGEQKLARRRSLHRGLTGDTDMRVEMNAAGFGSNGFANDLEGIVADAVDMKDKIKTMEFHVEIPDEDCGLSIQEDCLHLEDGVFVRTVNPDSYAAGSQILPGDKIIKVNEEVVDRVGKLAVENLLACVGRPVVLTMSRNLQQSQRIRITADQDVLPGQEDFEDHIKGRFSKLGVDVTHMYGLVDKARREASVVKLRQRHLHGVTKWVVHPEDVKKQGWDILILVLVMFNVLYIPMQFGFPKDVKEDSGINTFCDIMFIIDICLTFRTGFFTSNGILVMKSKIIRKRYLSSYSFGIDVLSSFPFEIVSIFFDSSEGQNSPFENQQTKILLRALKLPRLLRVSRLLIFLNRSKYKTIFKILRLFFVLFLAAHWGGCLFFWLCELQTPEIQFGNMSKSWCSEQPLLLKKRGLGRWWYSIYVSFMMLYGENIGPTTTPERIFVVAAIIVGQIVSAVVIGNISLVLTNQQSQAAIYQQKLDRATESMQSMHLPSKLQSRIFKYYDVLWTRHRTMDAKTSFVNDLNPSLKTDISLFLNRDIIANNPLFRNCPDGMILSVVKALKVSLYLQGCHLAREGELGVRMFFLQDGEVVAALKGKVLTHYQRGAYFGEISLLIPNQPRQCDLIAISNVEIRELNRDDFEAICFDFPNMKRILIENLKQQNYLEPKLILRCEAFTSSFDIPGKIKSIEGKLDTLSAQLNILTTHVMKSEKLIYTKQNTK